MDGKPAESLRKHGPPRSRHGQGHKPALRGPLQLQPPPPALTLPPAERLRMQDALLPRGWRSTRGSSSERSEHVPDLSYFVKDAESRTMPAPAHTPGGSVARAGRRPSACEPHEYLAKAPGRPLPAGRPDGTPDGSAIAKHHRDRIQRAGHARLDQHRQIPIAGHIRARDRHHRHDPEPHGTAAQPAAPRRGGRRRRTTSGRISASGISPRRRRGATWGCPNVTCSGYSASSSA